jgi:hypothetical protein
VANTNWTPEQGYTSKDCSGSTSAITVFSNLGGKPKKIYVVMFGKPDNRKIVIYTSSPLL